MPIYWQTMTSDLDLLQAYTRKNSEESFAALVNRHLNLVYSAALRQVRSPQLAEEVAQSVFTDLARNAGKLKPDTILTAWLYQVTRRTAIDVVRKESRRQLREQIATEMNTMNATADDWTHIEPLLDEAMHALDETDRAAVLLRYFENKSFRKVGATLGTTDDAAQKRVSRAVERLREFFTKRGVTVGASGLVVVISANAVQAAPVGLAVTISAAAVLAGTTTATTTIATTTKAIAMTTLQKTLIATTLAVVAGTGIYEAHQASSLRSQNKLLQKEQTPLTEQIRQLQRERDDATNRAASLLAEGEQSKSNENELLKLRGEVTRLTGVSGELAKLEKENDDLKSEVSSLEGRWFNVTNSPQFSMPYLKRDRWTIQGNGDPLEIFISAAAAARDGDEAKLAELISSKDGQSTVSSLFSKRRWNDVKGIQIVSIDYVTDASGQAKATVNTIIMKARNVPSEPGRPPALEDLIATQPVMHRWYLSKTETGWKITGGD